MNLLKKHSLPIFLILFSIIFALMGDQAVIAMQYERSLIMDGELWRLFTGHLIHAGWMHLWLNVSGLIIIWILAERYMCTVSWWTSVIWSSFLISMFFLLLMPHLEWYIGLSALLHAMFSASTFAGIRKGFKEAYALFALLVIKIVWEQMEGSLSAAFLGKNLIVIDSHMFGVICGIISIYLILIWKKLNRLR